jgi:hypothetical protein
MARPSEVLHLQLGRKNLEFSPLHTRFSDSWGAAVFIVFPSANERLCIIYADPVTVLSSVILLYYLICSGRHFLILFGLLLKVKFN